MEGETKPKYTGYGYHGGGRKPTGRKIIYKTVSISGLYWGKLRTFVYFTAFFRAEIIPVIL